MTLEEQQDDFEGNAIDILEAFIDSMDLDRRFMIPADEFDGPVEDNWSHVWTDRGSRLIERMIDRLYKLARLKFGEDAAFNMEISSMKYQEM